jgi:hypothetical protein
MAKTLGGSQYPGPARKDCTSCFGTQCEVPDLMAMQAGYPADDYPAYGYSPPAIGYVYPPPYYFYYGPPIYFGAHLGWGWRRWHR